MMILPTIHSNGTNKDALVRQVLDVSELLSDAMVAMSEMSPNERDYYPVHGSFDKAIEQYNHWDAALSNLIAELGEFAIAIDEA